MAENQPPEPPRFRAVQINSPPVIGSPGGPNWPELETQAFGINGIGQVVGTTEADEGAPTGFVWLPDHAYDVLAELDAVGITMSKWEEFLYVLEHEPMLVQQRWICWFLRHITQCTTCRPCLGPDPFFD